LHVGDACVCFGPDVPVHATFLHMETRARHAAVPRVRLSLTAITAALRVCFRMVGSVCALPAVLRRLWRVSRHGDMAEPEQRIGLTTLY